MTEDEFHGLHIDRDGTGENDPSKFIDWEHVWTIEVEDDNDDVLKRVLPTDSKSKEFRNELDDLKLPFARYWHPDTRYLIEESGMAAAFNHALDFMNGEEDLHAILSEGFEFLLDILEESDIYLTGDAHDLAESQASQMNTELLLSASGLMIPNYAKKETTERILSVREHTAQLSLELSQKKQSLIVTEEDNREEVFPVDSDTTATLIGLEVERMAAKTIGRKKSSEYFRNEVGVNHSLAPEPEVVLLVLQSGYLLLESGKILHGHRPHEALRERTANVVDRVRENIPSDKIREFTSDDEVSETAQATLGEWNSR